VLYVTDPRVAATYHCHAGDYIVVNDPAEVQWLVANKWAFDRTYPTCLPGAYYKGNRGTWVPYPGPAPSPPPPAPPARQR
ncbi:MAG TPA: hypothetical protein VKE42_00685, partial [Candidatus Cybelea sp.]|nr:hypothetical protein [Candidatus Cybelea sp.]